MRHALLRLRADRAGGPVALLVAACVLSSCGSSTAPVTEAAAPEVTATTSAPTTAATTLAPTTVATTLPPTTVATTLPPTTTSTTTTSTTSTTTTTTTTTSTLPTPEAAPVDYTSGEPLVALGRLAIPKIGVDMVMYEGVRLPTLEHGPGHWPGTAMPGQSGNVVVAGHRTSKHRVFRNIDDLVPGDRIVFTDPDGTSHTYSVSHTEIVLPTAMWIVNQTSTPTATLFACHPPGSTSHRIVVFADLVG